MEKLLDKIKSPADLKLLNIEELKLLAEETRQFLIDSLAETGGHLASNLGVVELTIALHYYLNSPRDKIIWDVGHQAYTHKILTGRKDKFCRLRKYQGLSGYLKREESIHDIIEAGHTSTSISAALGLALARDLKKTEERIYAVIGDGALTGGMAFEALNHAGHLKSDLTVILNDNEMCIAPNTGALSSYLSKIRTDPTLGKLKEDLEFLINRIPMFGSSVKKAAERINEALKYAVISGVLFEEMGFTYFGPVDGHNFKQLIDTFEKAERVDGPVFIHVNTCKGKGFSPAEKHPGIFHGVSSFDKKTGKAKNKKKQKSYSQVFGETMVKMGRKDNSIVAITAAMPRGTCLDMFASEFPDRFFDVGIAEQHAVTLAAGLARGKQKPVFAVYSTFLQRAFDQILQDVCMQKLPVVFAIDRAGIVGRDGETHQGVFDLSYLRMMPGMTIMAPADENELQHMLYTAISIDGPVAVRYPRGDVYGLDLDRQLKEIPYGQADILKEGEDILILAVGSTVYPAVKASDKLAEEGISAGVINARFIKPLDRELLLEKMENYRYIITVEENIYQGGFGSAVLELISKEGLHDVKTACLALPDKFIEHGSMEKIRELYGFTPRGIADFVKKTINGSGE